MKPQRIQLSRRKGFNLQEHSRSVNGLGAVKVDRSTKWGNPFYVGRKTRYGIEAIPGRGTFYCCGSTEGAVREYAFILKESMGMLGLCDDDLDVLRGKNLACWCPLPKDGEPDVCHAAVLLEIANR